MILPKLSSDSSRQWNARFFIYILSFQFTVIGIAALAQEPKSTVIGIFVLTLSLFLWLLVVCDAVIIFRRSVRNRMVIIARNLFIVLVNFVLKRFFKKEEQRKIPLRRLVAKLVFVSVFFILPSAFIALSVQGYWQIHPSSARSFNIIANGTHSIIESESGTVSIKPIVQDNLLREISNVLGNNLNYPLFNLCFYNNGTSPPNEERGVFSSVVNIDGQFLTIPYNGSYCYPMQTVGYVEYEWTTNYSYSIMERVDEGLPAIDPYGRAINDKRVEISYKNLLITYILILLSWWAICLLVINVFKKLDEL